MSDFINNRDTLRRLLDLYYSGEIDQTNEKTLRQLLRAPGLPEDFDADRRMFDAMEAEIAIPGELRSKIDRDINRRIFASRGRRWLSAAVAAAIAVLIAIALPLGSEHEQPADGSLTNRTDEQAAIEALTLLATTVRKGYDAVDRATAATDSLRHKVDKHITINTNEQV